MRDRLPADRIHLNSIMILLIQVKIRDTTFCLLHLNSIMILLIRLATLAIGIEIKFKFHYDSINSGNNNPMQMVQQVNLNSIMILLIPIVIRPSSAQSLQFKFHYDSINSHLLQKK